jgi:hypothetical protein
MDEYRETGEPGGNWLAPSEEFWKRHRCYLPPTYFRSRSDRWECSCKKTYRFDYDNSKWILEEANEA